MGDAVDEFIAKHKAAAVDPVDAFMAKHYGTVPEPNRGPLTMADGSPAPNDWAPVDANARPERDGAYEKFRENDSIAVAKRKASDDEQTRINNLPYLQRAGRRSLDAVLGATAGAVDRGLEIAGGVVDWGGATLKNVLTGNDYNQQQTDEIRTRQADRRANNGIGKALDRLEAQDTGGSVGTARTAGRMAADLGVMALPGAAGIHGAAGFAAGSVLTDPENPGMSAVNGALAYAGMKGGGSLLAKPIAAILERTAGKFLPETQRFLAKALTGVAEGAGMSAAPHVTNDGLHSALIGAIQGNPDDRVSVATNILLVAAFRAYGAEIPTPVAEAYVRGDFARVPKSLRPLMDSISHPIERAAGEVREMELRTDRPRRLEADLQRAGEIGSVDRFLSTTEPPTRAERDLEASMRGGIREGDEFAGARREGEAQRARARGEVERDDGSGIDTSPEAVAKAVNEAVAIGQVSPKEAFSPERVAVAEDAARRGQDPAKALESTAASIREDGTSQGRAGLPTQEALDKGLVDPAAVPVVEKLTAEGKTVVSSDEGIDGKGVAIAIDPSGKTVVGRGESTAAPKPRAPKKAVATHPETVRGGSAKLIGVTPDGRAMYEGSNPSTGEPIYFSRSKAGKLALETYPKKMLGEIAPVKPPDSPTGGPALMMNREGVTKAAEVVTTATKRVFGSFIERVRSRGTPTSIDVADRAEKAVDLTKKKLGEASPEIDAALLASGGRPGTPQGRAATALSRPTWKEGKDYGTSTLYDLIEGRQEPRTPEEAAIRDRGRELIDKFGRMSEDSKVQQFDPSSGEWDAFKNIPGGKVAPRIMAPDFQDVMLRGPSGDLWNKVIDAFADLNGIPRDGVERAFMDRHEAMVGDAPDATVKESQVEFRRQWRQVPTAIRHNGQTFDLFESNPYTYFKRLADSRAARLAVIDAFGQDVPAKDVVSGGDTDALMGGDRPGPEAPADTPNSLRKKFAAETGSSEDFTALMRGLHGGAIRKPILDPGSPAATIVRGVNQALKVIKTTMLSSSAVQNIPEPLGQTSALVGMPTVAKRAWQMLRQTEGWKADRAAAEINGAITRDVLNLSFDPTRPIQSGIRMFSELAKRAFGHGQVNESQESLAAVTATDMASRMKAGKGREIDVQRMKGTGVKDSLARRLANGTATPAEYDAFVRRAPGQSVGANLSPVEASSWEANRAVKALSAFARYSWMSARGAANQAAAYLSTMKSVIDGGLPEGEAWKRTIAAHRAVAEYGVGKALQGSAAYLLASFVTGGTTGLKIAASEAADNPLKFARDSFFYATFGGPIGAVVRIASGKDQIENAALPVFIGKEVWKLFGGNSDDPRYRDKSATERLWEFTKRVVPVYRAAETALVAIGLGGAIGESKQGHDIDTARRAFYRWKSDSPRKGPQFIPGDSTEGQIAYRREIKEAYEAVQRGDTPDVVNAHVMAALGIDGKKKSDVKSAIRAKKILDDKDVRYRLPELKSRIGEDAYRLLELHDELLDRLAKTIK